VLGFGRVLVVYFIQFMVDTRDSFANGLYTTVELLEFFFFLHLDKVR